MTPRCLGGGGGCWLCSYVPGPLAGSSRLPAQPTPTHFCSLSLRCRLCPLVLRYP